MGITVSRRSVLKTTYAIGAAVAGGIAPNAAPAQTRPADGPTDRSPRAWN